MSRHAPTLRLLFLSAILTAGSIVQADQYDAPASYYANATATDGLTLKSQLFTILTTGDDTVSYDGARKALQVIDQDPTDPNYMILFYDNTRLNVGAINSDGTNSGSDIKGWDLGVSWQREHTWPQSRQVLSSGATTSSGADYSDLHMLRPAGASNQARNNLNYGGTGTTAGTVTVSGSTYYYPGNAHKGEAARGAFYAAVRYNGSDANTVNLELVNGNPAPYTGQMGDLASLLRWHYEDVPDQLERRRNDLIHRATNWFEPNSRASTVGITTSNVETFVQGNRNPFIDHPEWVWAIFGGGNNNSKLSVATPAADGSSTKTIDFGKAIVGTTLSSSALTSTVTLSKTGDNPTYYSATPSGLATSDVTGNLNAFTYGTGSKVLNVGLNTSTSTVGLKTGQIVVNNLDITSGGTGMGSADGNDTINLSLTVVSHSNASFSGSADQDEVFISLGDINVGQSASTSLSIFNLGSGFVADLDLDSITASGDTDGFNTTLAALSGLDVGTSAAFDVTFTPTHAGPFTATYTIAVSDENIPGATAGSSLTLTVFGFGVLIVPEPTSGALVLIFATTLCHRRPRR